MKAVNCTAAAAAIDRAGALLVFPMDNRSEPASLWSYFFPRSPMRWEWDESGDDRVSNLWRLRGELSTMKTAVYTKWFKGRATYLSRSLFPALLRALNPVRSDTAASAVGLSVAARRVLAILEGESPLSTKELKRIADLKGRANEAVYGKALQELWSRLLIVAFGEVDDGAFPSLAVGSTRVLFEDLWQEAFRMSVKEAHGRIQRKLPPGNPFLKHYLKLRMALPPETETTKKKRNVPKVARFDEL